MGRHREDRGRVAATCSVIIFSVPTPQPFFFFENEADGCERLEEMGVELEIKRGGSCVCVCVFGCCHCCLL